MKPATMQPADWLSLFALSFLWGGSFFFVEIALTALPTLTIVALRVALAAAVLWLVVGGRMPYSSRAWRAFAGMSLLNNIIPFSLIVWGQSQISGGLASILNASLPLFTVVVAHFLLADEKLTRRRAAGVGVGFCGVAWMVGGDALRGWDKNILAQLAILAAVCSYAFAAVFGRRFAKMGLSPLQTACGQVTASAILLTPAALLLEKPWTLSSPSLSVWAAVVALAIFSTALAYILYFRILKSAGATNITLVTFLVPISAITLGAVFLNESLSTKHFFGMLLIGAGLWLIGGRKKLLINQTNEMGR